MNNYIVFTLVILGALVLVSRAAESEELVVSDEGDEVVFREVRSTRSKNSKNQENRKGSQKEPSVCRYSKGPWGDCDLNTNTRSRSLTLKKGNPGDCEQSKIENRKCKKACRYTKGQWSACEGPEPSKERIDQLKHGSDPSCEPTRKMTKKCKSGKMGGEKKMKKLKPNKANKHE